MRDIKFRAYDNDIKEMLYNVQNTYDYSCTNDNKVMEDRFADLLNNQRYEVMQYTGLKDKKGVEIYEGDIVKNNCHDIFNKDIGTMWEVKYGEYNNSDIEYGSGGNIGFYCEDYYDIEGLNNLPCDYNDGIEVIGNIYDNPELLKREEI